MKPKISDPIYSAWILQLKQKFQQAQIKAAMQVNQELLRFYWELGADIVEKQGKINWGSKFLEQLSFDLQSEFPEVKGFSYRNIKYIRQWYLFYIQHDPIGQQLVAQLEGERDAISQQAVDQLSDRNIKQLFKIPWGHHIAIISKCKSISEAQYYVTNTITHGWSRAVLVHQIGSNTND